MKITLDLTKHQTQIIRDSLNLRCGKEQKYRDDIKRFHSANSIKNLLELSERNQDEYARLADLFHGKLVLTEWKD